MTLNITKSHKKGKKDRWTKKKESLEKKNFGKELLTNFQIRVELLIYNFSSSQTHLNQI